MNINTDLEAYDAIKPCGFDSKIMTSLKQLKGKEISEIEVKEFTRHREIYGWFLIPAFFAGLGMETFRNIISRYRA